MKIDTKLKEKAMETSPPVSIIQEINLPTSSMPSTSNANINRILLQKTGGGVRSRSNLPLSTLDIKRKILNFVNNEPKIDACDEDFNILQYWHMKRDVKDMNEIYNISQIVYGGAFSQVKSERDFSIFALIYTHLRTKISPETLNAVFMMKCNLDLIEKVNFV